MSTAPIRLTMVLTHPVQYYAPWFRYIAARRPELDLTVLYGAIPTPDQQGTGFGQAFEWDVPLTEGYRYEVCSDAAGKRFDSDTFFGLDVPDIEGRLEATKPDVVLVPGWHSAMHLRALRACRRLGVPALYRGDSTLFSGPRGLVRPLWWLKTRAMLRQFDAFLSVGTDAAEYLRAFGVPEPLIVRSPHCVDNDWFAERADVLRQPDQRRLLRRAIEAEDDDFVVLFAGKLQPRKRPLDAVRAVASLGPSAVLLTVGDGPLADEMRAEARRFGVRLAWQGFRNQSEMPAAFAAADCLLVPSAWESWGLIVNEALASGVPCVTTDRVAAARDLVVPGETGHTAPVGSVAVLAERLREVRLALHQDVNLSAACRRRADAVSFAAATDGLVAASTRVITHKLVAIDRNPGQPRVIVCAGAMVNTFGMERAVFEALTVLREQGAAVHGIVNRWDSSRIVTRLEEIGASWTTGYYWYPLRRRVKSLMQPIQLAWDMTMTSAGLLRDARRFQATHVLVPDFTVALRNLPALVLLRLLRVPVLLSLQNAPDVAGFYRWLWRWLVNAGIGQFVANSHFTAQELRRNGVPARKARVVYNTAPARALPAGDVVKDPSRIIYVGQMIPPKGIELLLEAVSRLRQRGLDVNLDAVGDIDGWEPPSWQGFRAKLRERSTRPDLNGHVRFLGVREDVPALLAGSGVHCCPSLPEIREAFGIVNVEAKAAGIPSVVLPTGGLPELIEHRRNGWVCTDSSLESLVEGLDYFLSDAGRREEAGREARASFAKFGREPFAAGWLDAFGIPRPAPPRFVATPLQEEATPRAH